MEYDRYKKIFDKNNGIIKTSDFTEAGFHNTVLNKLIKEGKIAKIKPGYYEWNNEIMISDAVIINKLYPDAIVCMNSVLYIYNYVDRTPNKWHLAVNKNSSKSRFNLEYPKLKIYYLLEYYLDIGVSKQNYEGHEMRVYDKERTICDVIRYERKIDKEIFNQAIKSYINDNSKDISTLIEYARKMNIEKKTKMIIGMWL